ncbi:SNF2 N-terminal domain family protein [Clavispora lusitaniae]|uniref:SNF2 N-terminal domain family protein n=1 Tax=Clavispora lusitaniae TaxID=36911 RepID=UPI00202C1A7C|nr:SNF2 N-terminal domain family protein [Clavispora lusitaniae]
MYFLVLSVHLCIASSVSTSYSVRPTRLMYKNAQFKPPRLIRKTPPEESLFVPDSERPARRLGSTRRLETRSKDTENKETQEPRERIESGNAQIDNSGDTDTNEVKKTPISEPGLADPPTQLPSSTVKRRVLNNANGSSSGPLHTRIHLHNPLSDQQDSELPGSAKRAKMSPRYYTVQWRKRSNRKHKPWEGDGVIVVSDSGSVLKIENKGTYRIVGRSKSTYTDGILRFGTYEAEVDCETSKEELVQQKDEKPALSSSPLRDSAPMKKHIPRMAGPISAPSPTPKVDVVVESAAPSLVLPAPKIPNANDVSVDPLLTKHLKPHQRDGVSFVYSCLLGMHQPNYFGALLADEMGLGKTLMTITVIWTLLKQSPFPGQKKVASKVLICCPVSLIDNWRREFTKWLGTYRIGVLCLNNKQVSPAKDKDDIVNFGKNNVYQVLIMSYEKTLSCSKELDALNLDILVCDEGHRLKSGSNRVFKVLSALSVEKRLLLTGTPIQNDLNEFYTIINFINPGILGTQSEFQKNYLRPILRARDVNCHDLGIIREGKDKSAELIQLTKSFILRRTKDIISNCLTRKTDVIIFCAPTKVQKSLFEAVSKSSKFNSVMRSETKDVLSMILMFRKICNSPSLLHNDPLFASFLHDTELSSSSLSSRTTGSKVNVLVPLLLEFRTVGEKVVLVSNYAQTLDFLETVLSKLNLQYCRLDGSTPAKVRDKLVLDFNKCPTHKIFLLSAKAGGVGLNLVGASRLILFDNDWNPSVDLQAMARVHRYGQTKPVFIYRLFTTGAIDEKIFQRQLMKNNLSDMFLDEKSTSASNIFDFEDLKDLFTIADTNCNTHDLIECDCEGTGEDIDLTQAEPKDTQEDEELPSSGWMSALEFKELDGTTAAKRQVMRTALSNYRHFDPSVCAESIDTGDDILNKLIVKTKQEKTITYVFTHVSSEKCSANLTY